MPHKSDKRNRKIASDAGDTEHFQMLPLPDEGHEPVLLRQTLDALDPAAGKTVVDCTLGRGGHSLALARALGPAGLLIALDADSRNLEHARHRLTQASRTGETAAPLSPIRFFHANFSDLADVLDAAGIASVDGILADLGISTNQLFECSYGMSFSVPMPLDMRIDPASGPSAADLVNTMREEDLANVLYLLAQERYSRRIARKIVEARRASPITTTDQLAALVRGSIPNRGGAPERIDPATRTFLALRMKVNRELENLDALLKQSLGFLRKSGRLAVISFQSTEDRVVKQSFRSAEQDGLVRILTKKPIAPADAEAAANPRSRSAKLRAVEKT